MEIEQEKKYFIIWLYISILLHLFVVIIMLTIKPATSSSKDPDPAHTQYNKTQVIFMQDQPIQDEPAKQNFEMAKREQGGSVTLQHSQVNQNNPTQDIPTPALSNDYKKGIQNQTNIDDQDEEGNVNIIKDAIIDQKEQLESQNFSTLPNDAIIETIENSSPIEIPKQDFQIKTKELTPGDILKTIIQEKMHKQTDVIKDRSLLEEKDSPLQSQLQKVISKKHRPADIGQENLSKVQLSKISADNPVQKKKLSLQDIQNGFSQFIRNGHTVSTTTIPTASTLGNSLFFSTDGNSDKDDIAGLKRASYMHQIGQMYQNAGREYIEAIFNIARKEGIPEQNNYIAITIERSGNVSQTIITQSCGNAAIDNYHLKIIESIGNFPPIPKYIDAPIHITAYLPFQSLKIGPQGRIYRK